MILAYFGSFGLFDDEEVKRVVQLFERKKLNKHDCFVSEGESCTAIAFIQSGIFRSHYQADDGTEHTFCFRFPNQLMAPYSAFITGGPSVETMQAITDAEILVAKVDRIRALIDTNPKWVQFLKRHAEHEYIELEKRFFQFQRDSATKRYHALLTNQPDYVRQIPLQYLASYLGVTQRHLSRIRAAISF